MLKQLSKFERTSKVLILGFVALMAVSLVLFFRPGGGSSAIDPSKSSEVVASVGGDDITLGEFQTQKQNLQMQFSRFGGQISLSRLGYTDDKILDGLIQRKIAVQEARRLGLEASPAEVSERIRKTFSDAAGKLTLVDSSGKLDMAKYEQRVGDVAAFERGVAEDIAREKLEAFVSASVRVSEEDLQADFKKKNTTFDLTYAVVSPSKLAEKIQPTDDDMKSYFEAHKNDYNIAVPQKKVRYVFIDQDKSGQKLQIPDKDLHDEYDNLDPKYKQAGVKVQQIVLKIARPDLDASVKAKAEGLVAKARANGETITEDAFGELARGNSEDPATAKDGGRVNGIVKKDANKKDDPFQQVLEMQPGDVTDPIKYKNGYYILRRGDGVPKTFEDARKELEVSLRNRRGYTAAQKIAQKAQDRLKETKDPQKVAQEFAGEANMNAADMVRETPFVKPGDDVPNVGSSQAFEDVISPLNAPNEVGERVGVKNGFAVPMLVEQKPPRIPEFDEVKDKVRAAVKDQKAKEMLDQKAKEIAAVKSPGELKAAAEKAGLEAKAEANYKLSTPLGDSGSSVLLDDPLYAAKAGDVLQPILLNSNYIILGVNKKTDADLTEYAKQRDSMMQEALSERKNQIFEDYLNSVMTRLKQSGKIRIYKEVLDAIAENEEQALPPTRPRPQLPITK
jgi:peptidyl-prolyl cis-trans isomerase D